MNNKENKKNTVITKNEWSAKEYCCDRMKMYLSEKGSALELSIDFKGDIIYLKDGSGWYTTINYCPNCGTKVITEK